VTLRIDSLCFKKNFIFHPPSRAFLSRSLIQINNKSGEYLNIIKFEKQKKQKFKFAFCLMHILCVVGSTATTQGLLVFLYASSNSKREDRTRRAMRVVGLYISIYVCVCASPSCIVIAQSIARVGQHTARRDRGINQITGVMRWRGRRKKNIYIIYIYSRIITLENETVFFSFFSLAFLCLFFLFFLFLFLSVATKLHIIYI
jgi:hypothetical protein